jgi:hypothetical protein
VISRDAFGYSGFWDEIKVTDIIFRRYARIGKAGVFGPTDVCAIGPTYNELWHAWYDKYLEETDSSNWLKQLVQNERQYGKGDVLYGTQIEMAEEAVSNLVNRIIDALESKQPIPTYREALESDGWKRWLTPTHDDPGEKWAGNAKSSLPMSERLFYATIWLMYHGDRHPCKLGEPLTLKKLDLELRKHFQKTFHSNWPKDKIDEFLSRDF